MKQAKKENIVSCWNVVYKENSCRKMCKMYPKDCERNETFARYMTIASGRKVRNSFTAYHIPQLFATIFAVISCFCRSFVHLNERKNRSKVQNKHIILRWCMHFKSDFVMWMMLYNIYIYYETESLIIGEEHC